MIESRINYIHENPVKPGLVEEEDYLYSNARNYFRIDSRGLLVAQWQIVKEYLGRTGCKEMITGLF